MNGSALQDIIKRCQGEFYLGIVGPVRSGKSTFINKFMEMKILPLITDDYLRQKVVDELPQTAQGKKIMTVEPKFVPTNAITVNLGDLVMNTRLVDCVGYIIPNATGHFDDEGPRMVKTPWFDEPIPFKEAAEIGTKKVILNHSTVGIVLTSDGSFSDFSRSDYASVEEVIINQLIEIKKPFVVVLNTNNPSSPEAMRIRDEIATKYEVSVVSMNVLNMNSSDIDLILKEALNEFEIEELNIKLPNYISVLNDDNPTKHEIMEIISGATTTYKKFKEVQKIKTQLEVSQKFQKVTIELLEPERGICNFLIDLDDHYFNDIIIELIGHEIKEKSEYIALLQEYVSMKKNFSQLGEALTSVYETGYGVSYPTISQMKLLKPEVIKHAGRYGVKLKAIAPSIHLIRVDVESAFEPIIGSEEQSKMLIDNLLTQNEELSEVWDKEIFGRKLSEVVNDGIKAKIHMIPSKAKLKLRDTLEKIVNTGSGGMIAIIL